MGALAGLLAPSYEAETPPGGARAWRAAWRYPEDPLLGDLRGLDGTWAVLTAGELAAAPIVLEQAALQGVDPNLIMAVISRESNFVPTATHTDRDGKQSYGLMQLRWDTATGLAQGAGLPLSSPGQLFDPAMNITLGTRYLAYQLRRYGGILAVADAVAAYNAGTAFRTASGAYTNQPYVTYVLAAFNRYSQQYVEPAELVTTTTRAPAELFETRAMAPSSEMSMGAGLGIAAVAVLIGAMWWRSS